MQEFSDFIGLSRPTVSKYFRDPASVRKSTRDAIEAGLEKSQFRPSILAVNLNRQRSSIIGIIVPNLLDPFYMALTRRIEIIPEKAGSLAFVLSSDVRIESEENAVRIFKSMNVAGAVVAPLASRLRRPASDPSGEGIPVVYVDSPKDEGSAFIGTDNGQSFGLIVDYLCRSGEPPCFFGMHQVNVNAAARLQTYRQAMEALGFEPRALALREAATWDFERFAFVEAERLFDNLDRLPSRTILCANNRQAFGVIAAAWKRGLKIGHGPANDLRITGHDDHPFSRFACPPLTTVTQDYNEIGRLAIELLLRRLGKAWVEGSQQDRILLRAELMLRHSA